MNDTNKPSVVGQIASGILFTALLVVGLAVVLPVVFAMMG